MNKQSTGIDKISLFFHYFAECTEKFPAENYNRNILCYHKTIRFECLHSIQVGKVRLHFVIVQNLNIVDFNKINTVSCDSYQ